MRWRAIWIELVLIIIKAWRMLTRSFLPPEKRASLLAYTPMLHARLFNRDAGYRAVSFQPLKSGIPSPPDFDSLSQLPESDKRLDGHPATDRPLIVQFCANDTELLLQAARYVAPFCDAVDLNLGCPQGIAKRGNYGAFLQEEWGLIYKLINILHENLDIPVTAKIRVLESKEKTLEYAKMVLSAGASILTVHGRRREQKGHNTGLADWSYIRYLRDNLPPETVIFANGNILQHDDIETCLKETGVDGVMSAEGNLHDPAIFTAAPGANYDRKEYWVGKDSRGGWRMDAVMRRYLDILYKHVLGVDPPDRSVANGNEQATSPAKKYRQQPRTEMRDLRQSGRRKAKANTKREKNTSRKRPTRTCAPCAPISSVFSGRS